MKATTNKQEHLCRRKHLLDKEKFAVYEPCTIRCPDTSHPAFYLKISVDKPWAVCYYCSKTWTLEEKPHDDTWD